MRTIRHAGAVIFMSAMWLSLATQALADDAIDGVVYALRYTLGSGWVEAKLLRSSGGPDVVAVTTDDRAVAVLASAMAKGDAVTIYVDHGTPKSITRIEWDRPRVQEHVDCK